MYLQNKHSYVFNVEVLNMVIIVNCCDVYPIFHYLVYKMWSAARLSLTAKKKLTEMGRIIRTFFWISEKGINIFFFVKNVFFKYFVEKIFRYLSFQNYTQPFSEK